MRIHATDAIVFSCGMAIAAHAGDGDILEREVLSTYAQSTAIVERVIYESDGLRILGYLAYPQRAPKENEKLPCLLFNRGGNRDFGMLTPERASRIGSMAAAWGYVFFASNYRGSPGSQGRDEFGGADVNDVVNAIRVFDQLDFADGARVGMWGHSRGGMMTYIALKKTDRVDAAVVGAGPSEWSRALQQRPEMESHVLAECVPDWPASRAAALKVRSASMWPEQLPHDVPILLIHGTADRRVDPRDSLEMSLALLDAKRPFRLIMFEGADHAMTEFRDQYRSATRQWLDDYVRDGKPGPDLIPHGR